MKFEFVEFYRWQKQSKCKTLVGTVHIYAIDCELDIRGIRVFKSKRGVLFLPPCEITMEYENEVTCKKIRYPIVNWTNQKTQKEMMDFLNHEVKPLVLERLTSEAKSKE